MITLIEVSGKPSEKTQKKKEEVGNSIKYLIEQKNELERHIRVGQEAEKELQNLEKKLKVYMAEYLFIL